MAVADARSWLTEVCYAMRLYEDGLTDSPDVNGQVATARGESYGTYKGTMEAALDGLQAAMGAVLSPAQIQSALFPGLLAYAEELGVPIVGQADPYDILERINDSLIAAGDAVESRAITFGTPTAFSPATKGRLKRLTVARDGSDLEVGLAEVLTFRCTNPFGAVPRYQEIFEVSSEVANPFGVARDGSGLRQLIQAVGPDLSLLDNPRLNSGSKGLDGWTATDETKVTKVTTSTYLPPVDPAETQTVCRISGTTTLSQVIPSTRGILQRGVPLHLVVWAKPSGVTGTLQPKLGASFPSAITLSGSSWTAYEITMGEGSWYDNYASGLDEVSVQLVFSISAGTVDIGHVGLYQLLPIRGQWYLLEAGPDAWAYGDSSTVTDTIASDSNVQYYIQRGFGVSLASATPNVNWADS